MLKIFFMIVICSLGLYAQEGNPLDDPKKEQSSQPLELPNYVIEGVERLNVRSGIKQPPVNTFPLDNNMLDSLNSLEKKQVIALPMEALPTKVVDTEFSNGYLQASYGIFNTAEAEASLGFDVGGYDIYLNAGIEASDGDQKNSDYSKIYAKAFSDYIADDKFYIFGGSKTRTMIDVAAYDYNLYGFNYGILPAAEQDIFSKKMYDLKARVDNEGAFKSVMFKTGVGFETVQLAGSPVKSFDNSLNGYIRLQSYLKNFLIAGNFSLDLRNASGNTTNFTSIDGSLEYFNRTITIRANGGFQFAVNSNEIDRAGLLLSGELEYRINDDFTFGARAYSGLDKNAYRYILKQNPYFNSTPLIDHPYNIADIESFIFYHPTTKIGITAGMEYKIADRMINFQYDTLGSFNVLYLDGYQGKFMTEIYWDISSVEKITGNFDLAFSELSDNGNSKTYLPNMTLGGNYSRKWFDSFTTGVGMVYVGERYADIENNITLDPYFDMKIEFSYDITNKLNVFLHVNNLLNQDVYIWQNYKERTLFARLGVLWQL